ncbi:MAG: DEAD/DEAH box helicase family protein [Leptospirales bacterium]
MEKFPENIKFALDWRPYQSRVLQELEFHLDDNHLNIVAAPGSGKTILGLEVMLRLNKPTLILAPTIAIRNQWIAHFMDHFLQTREKPSWISSNIRDPRFLTVSTYQGLHAAFTRQNETGKEELEVENFLEADMVENATSLPNAQKTMHAINQLSINTIVIDEAHHLRNAWWKSLTYLKENIANPHVVALTATPPYDVSPAEWKNYQNLCGPIDAEISVPELVLEENLCPHQDYVYLNSISREENVQINKFRSDVKNFDEQLNNNRDFIAFLKTHPCLLDPEKNIEIILKNPEYYSGILIFLLYTNNEVSPILLKILGGSKRKLPLYSLEWAEILLQNCLYRDDYFKEHGLDIAAALKHNLKKIGAIEKQNIYLINNSRIKQILKESLNKLNSILEIVKLEHENLGDNLRMVILTDFIRKEYFPKKGEPEQTLSRIGLIPIFEKIRREYPKNKKIGILSGSVVVIPYSAIEALKISAKQLNISQTHLTFTKLSHDTDFVKVAIKGENNQKIVHLITEIFNSGEIEILTGTKSLLGEGWDAPSINTLVLASFVGSFMLSNQMRGRAIRIDNNHPGKISNIWHLASVEKNSLYPGHDFDTLTRRFKSFVGISFAGDTIENGFKRMAIGVGPFSERKIQTMNGATIDFSKNRNLVKERWIKVLDSGVIKNIIPELKTEKKDVPRSFVFRYTILSLLVRTLFVGAAYIIENLYGILNLLRFNRYNHFSEFLGTVGLVIFIGIIITTPGLVKTLFLFLKHGPVAGSMKNIGDVILKTLSEKGVIKTDVSKLRVIAEQSPDKEIFCGLEGGTSYEKSVFLDCLEEIVEPIENPRYILIRKSRLKFWERIDFHAVPRIIGTHKESAEQFSYFWKKLVGNNNLVYTRSITGRKLLLKARQNSLSTAMQKRSERIDTWK